MPSPAYPTGLSAFPSSSAMQSPLYGAGVPANNGQPQPVAQPASTTPQFGQLPTNFHATAPYGTVPMGYPQQAMVRSGLRGNPQAAAAYAQLANEPLPAEGNPLLVAGGSLALAGAVSLGTTEATYRMGLDKQLANTKTTTTPAAALTDDQKLAVEQKFVADENAKLLQEKQKEFDIAQRKEVQAIVPKVATVEEAIAIQQKKLEGFTQQQQQVKNKQAYQLLVGDSTKMPADFDIMKEIARLRTETDLPSGATPPQPAVPLADVATLETATQQLESNINQVKASINTSTQLSAQRQQVIIAETINDVESRFLEKNLARQPKVKAAKEAFAQHYTAQKQPVPDLKTVDGVEAYLAFIIDSAQEKEFFKSNPQLNPVTDKHLYQQWKVDNPSSVWNKPSLRSKFNTDSLLNQETRTRATLKQQQTDFETDYQTKVAEHQAKVAQNKPYFEYEQKRQHLIQLEDLHAQPVVEVATPPKKEVRNLWGLLEPEQPAVDERTQAQQKLEQLEKIKQTKEQVKAPTVEVAKHQTAIDNLIAAEQAKQPAVTTAKPAKPLAEAEGWGKAWQHDTKALKTEGFEDLAKHTDHAHAMGRWAGLAVALLGTGLTIQQFMQSKEAETAAQTRAIQLAQLRQQQGLGG
jgi:hypothetical protein